MKIKNIVFLFFTLTKISIIAQIAIKDNKKQIIGSWNTNSKIISFGIGFPTVDPFYFNKNIRSSTTTTLTNFNSQPVQHIKGEIAFVDNIGFAVCVNRSLTSFDQTYFSDYYQRIETINITEKVLTVNLRANYHFLYNKLIDPYFGIGVGFRKIGYQTQGKQITVFEAKTPFGFETTFGVRTLIKSLIGIYIEAGISRSLIQGGITLNLGKRKYN